MLLDDSKKNTCIKVKIPLRISFIGGGTDIPSFYKRFGGVCVNATIDKYVTVTVKRCFGHPRSLHSDTVKAALDYTGMSEVYVEIEKDLSVQGLGTSSAVIVGLLKALYAFQDDTINEGDLAETAYVLEREILNQPGGKQDFYSASYGGLREFRFRNDGKISENTVLNKKQIDSNYLMLFDTGVIRDRSIKAPHESLNSPQLEILKTLVSPFCSAISDGNFELMGHLLSAAWSIKKRTHPSISTEKIGEIYDTAIRTGAWGGKLLGGGGGGAILFVVPLENRERIKSKLELLGTTHIPFDFSYEGAIRYDK